jgi:predicted GNAT superfamily acetyltransferase
MSNEQTPSYLEVASGTYGLIVEAAANANHRYLEHLKSTYEIVSRPYTSTAFEATYRENLDRAGQLVELNVAAAQKNGAELAALAEKLAKHASQWQESYVETLRGLFRTGLSNLAFVKDAADQTYEGFAKRVEEIQNRATAGVSSN